VRPAYGNSRRTVDAQRRKVAGAADSARYRVADLRFVPHPHGVRRFQGTTSLFGAFAVLCALVAPAEARVCEVSMQLDSAVTLGALQLELDWSRTSGNVATTGGTVVCAGDVANALSMFGHAPQSERLTSSTLSLIGFTGPTEVAHCTFEDAAGLTDAKDFALHVSDSTDPDGDTIANVHVSIAYGPCDDDTTTTTTSSTTTTTTTSTTTSTTTTSTSTTSTTLDDCGNGIVEGNEECDDSNHEDGDGCDSDCTGLLCGDANGNDSVQASDALLVLRAATGQQVTCPVEFCDTDGDSMLRASDSLRVLKRAVGQSVPMTCPAP
jgi:cysteine-rich repeat protein